MATTMKDLEDLELPEGVRPNDLRLPPMPLLGFRNYWYPATYSRRLRGTPLGVRLLGEDIVLTRVGDKAYAIQGRCPHRGAPLAMGSCMAPGVLTCRYHGFSFDVTSGQCVAVLTEGPESPTPAKLRATTYPVEERHGFVWVYMGEGTPPPLDEDLPEEFLHPDAVVASRLSMWDVHWRVAVDNGVDAAHVPFLHRSHPLVRFRRMPSFFKVRPRRDGKWLRVVLEDVGFSADFPGVGRWPRDLHLRRATKPAQTSVRLPGIVRIAFPGKYVHIRWAVPVDEHTTQTLQCLVRNTRGLGALWFKLYYYGWQKWLYHVSFQRQDEAVLQTIDRLTPEVLTQSDAIIIQWRRLASEARQAMPNGSA